MDYEKKYNEALERARRILCNIPEGSPIIRDIETIFPKLRESEEERIRKDIIGGLMWQRDNLKSEDPHDNNLILPGFCFTVGKHLAYLEKQKEEEGYEAIPVESTLEYKLGFKAGKDSEKQKEQEPAEWSEEDEKMLNDIIGTITYAWGETSDRVSWLKSLKNRGNSPKSNINSPHWKPSEEQMEAFKGYIEDCQARAEAAVGGWNNFDVMIRLYEQLQKLKGGVAPMKEVDE